MYKKLTQEMTSFIKKNPTAFHTVNSISKILDVNGYERLMESKIWNLKAGKRYYVTRNDSSIIAFCIGEELTNYSFNIVSSHTDSPVFKIKEKAEIYTEKKYTRLNTEGYGGMICSTWMDRPLSIAGRVLIKEADGSIMTRLLTVDHDLLMIPSVAIHMNRDVNDGYKFNKQVDMLPLFSGDTEDSELTDLIAKELNVNPNQIMGSDLYLYSRENASIWGKNEEFVSCARLDDQECVFASLKALLESDNKQTVNVMACFDNEEVGSGTKQGADSTFLYDVLKRINSSIGKNDEDYIRAMATSFMISADNAHAVHPNHPELTDVNNCVYMNEGVVVKSHAGQKYTSDGVSIAIIKELASRADVPLQYFANRSDKAGGSTLGNIAMSHVSMNCIDLGLPQLAMHSCYETAGTKDIRYMVSLMKELYSSHIEEISPGCVIIK